MSTFVFDKLNNRILIFLFSVLGGLTVNLIGIISVSELYILLISPWILRPEKLKSEKSLLTATILYSTYLCCQLLSELVVGNSLNNWTRGIAVTIISFLTFIYLYDKIKKDKLLIIIYLSGLIVREYLFPTMEEEVDVAFKFHYGPMLLNALLIVSYFLLKEQRRTLAIILFYVTGFVYIALDSRSMGLTIFFVGLIMQFGESALRNRRKIMRWTLVLIGLSYGLYVIYIAAVLNKVYGGEHSYSQISQMEQPYNPLNLLKTGRAEFFVAFEAISDAPFFGHGTWASDKNGKYIGKVFEYQAGQINEEYLYQLLSEGGNYATIPSHSIIMGAGVNNGLLALLAITALILFFIWKCIQAMDFNSPFIFILTNSLLTIVWSSLFSPLPHLKNIFPFLFSIILVLYHKKMNGIKLKLLLLSLFKKKEVKQNSENVDNTHFTNTKECNFQT